jgi:hypothetical protein
MARRARKAGSTSSDEKQDLAAIAIIKSSGILNRNAKLDAIIKLSEQLHTEAQAGGHVFIFTNVVFRKCPF